MPALTLDRITKTYRSADGRPAPALRDFSLQMEDGELLAVVGPSGSGKTTLLRIIAGLEKADSGSVSLGGRVLDGVAPKDRGVALVPQSAALYPHMTARANIAFGLRIRGVGGQEICQRVAEAAQVLGLAGCLDRRPEHLSGGERQRVSLGRALVLRPEIFLMDEPLSQLDPPMRLQLREEIVRVHRLTRVPTVYVTHDQSEALALGNRVAVVNAGELLQAGAPGAIYNTPHSAFVAGFIGAPPINLIRGEVRLELGKPVFAAESCGLQMAVPARVAETVRERQAILGIRPERVKLVENQQLTSGNLEGSVEAVQVAGPDAIVSFRSGTLLLRARLAGSEALPEPGTKRVFAVDATAAHWFDGMDERRVG